ncbi:MAG: hypothetical protein ACM3KF_00055 [Acidobacteriota bacterium]
MRKFLAGSALAMVIALGGLGLSATTAHAEGNTITVEQGKFTYTCTTEVQPKESMKLKIDGVQYTCYSPDKEASDNANNTFGFIMLGIFVFFFFLMLLSLLF